MRSIEKYNLFPYPARNLDEASRIGPRAVGWPASEVEALISARISGKSDAEMKDLVHSIVAKRIGQDRPLLP